MTTSSPARCVAEHLVGEAVCHVATNPAGDVVWLGAGPAVKVLTSRLTPVVGFEVGTSGTHVASLAASNDALAVVSATTLELYSLAGRCVAELDLAESPGARAAFTGDGQTLVLGRACDEGRTLVVELFDATTGEVIASPSLPASETIESCSVFPAGERGALVAGWDPDCEHCNIVVRVDAATGTLTALDQVAEAGVIGADPTGAVALGLPHGSGTLWRLDVRSGGATPWVHEFTSDDGRTDALNSLSDTSSAVFLDERLAVVVSEYEDPLLVDVGAEDGSPRPLQLGCVFAGPSFVRRLGRRSFLTVEAHEGGARFRAWALE